ncbi:MAG: hypothetical protein J4G13_04470 [Dehalococcoidia bacterium]|nr:hypothetical protein [Dehalococcoidia bacterium]
MTATATSSTPGNAKKTAQLAPAKAHFIDHRDKDEKEALMARYSDYLTRRNALNPHNPIDVNRIR